MLSPLITKSGSPIIFTFKTESVSQPSELYWYNFTSPLPGSPQVIDTLGLLLAPLILPPATSHSFEKRENFITFCVPLSTMKIFPDLSTEIPQGFENEPG